MWLKIVISSFCVLAECFLFDATLDYRAVFIQHDKTQKTLDFSIIISRKFEKAKETCFLAIIDR